MAILKINIEVIEADEQKVDYYYQTAAKNINLLLEKYNIRNAQDQFEKVSADQLRDHLSVTGFFQPTPLKFLFIDQKRQFIPAEIIHAFQSILSHPPRNIKALFLNKFIKLLQEKGWDKSLSKYFEFHYDVPQEGIILLEDLKDFSFGQGVYQATFRLLSPHRKDVNVFLKRSQDLRSSNELLYFHLQKVLLPTASHAQMPYKLSNRENTNELLLSPLNGDFTSDTMLSLIIQTYRKTTPHQDTLKLKQALEIIIEAYMSHAALGDILGRNDRHLLNSLMAFIVDGKPQKNTLDELHHSNTMLLYATHIVTHKTNAISLIDLDLKWLLGEKNADWTLVDIDFGLSELNLLSLLEEFNDYNSLDIQFFEKRRLSLAHYFNVYCQQQEAILKQKESLFSAITKFYPPLK